MERVEEHLRAASWYEALMTASSTIEKLNRQKKYDEALVLAATAMHGFALYRCPNPDEYKTLLVKVINCLVKQQNEVVVVDYLRLVFEALAFIQVADVEKLGTVVEAWFSGRGIPMSPAILSWVAPYMPSDRQYTTAARGCYLNPLLMKTEEAYCLYVLNLLAVGNIKVAKEAAAAYTSLRGPVADVAELAISATQKQSTKGIKLIRTRCRDSLTQEMRTLLNTIEAKFCASTETGEELD